jgi:hypothetical protein
MASGHGFRRPAPRRQKLAAVLTGAEESMSPPELAISSGIGAALTHSLLAVMHVLSDLHTHAYIGDHLVERKCTVPLGADACGIICGRGAKADLK